MSEWLFAAAIIGAWAIGMWAGYWIGTVRAWHQSADQNADHIAALERLLHDLQAREPAAINPAVQPHEHAFTYGAQRRDHEWDFRVCQVPGCGAENARKAGGH